MYQEDLLNPASDDSDWIDIAEDYLYEAESLANVFEFEEALTTAWQALGEVYNQRTTRFKRVLSEYHELIESLES